MPPPADCNPARVTRDSHCGRNERILLKGTGQWPAGKSSAQPLASRRGSRRTGQSFASKLGSRQLVMQFVMHPRWSKSSQHEEIPGFPGFLLCKLLCNLLCRLLCTVSVACMHNKLRPGLSRSPHRAPPSRAHRQLLAITSLPNRSHFTFSSPWRVIGARNASIDNRFQMRRSSAATSDGQMEHGQVRKSRISRQRPLTWQTQHLAI